MKSILFTAILGLAALALFAAGCGESGADSGGQKTAVVLRKAVAPEFKGMTNPTPDAKAEGGKLFKVHCVSCHGENGKGDTPVGKALNPPAGDLTSADFQKSVGDDYIFWHITVGAAAGPAGSGMTPFKDAMTEAERWQVVSFVRSLK